MPNDPSLGRTAFARGARKLAALCDASGVVDRKPQIVGMFNEVAGLCGDRDVRLPPRWSGVTDDCTPFEFSVALHEGRPNIRLLVEAQDDPACPQSYWKAGMRLNDWLARNHRIDLAGFRQIEDLFVPHDPTAAWAMWHGVDFARAGSPLFKLYLFPHAQGPERADAVLRDALSRLGFADAWSSVAKLRGAKDMFSHLSLDLTATPRLKVYIRHHDATLDALEARGATAGIRPGDWAGFCRAIAQGHDPLSLRPIFAAYHLNGATAERLQHAVLYLPLFPFAANDAIAHERISGFLAACGIASDIYSDCVTAMADGPLERERGLHTYLAFQRRNGLPQVTAYFGSRLYWSRYWGLVSNRRRCWPSPVT
jgi:DMATS type aromatic prenyltransferase